MVRVTIQTVPLNGDEISQVSAIRCRILRKILFIDRAEVPINSAVFVAVKLRKTSYKLPEFSFADFITVAISIFNNHLNKLTNFKKCSTS